MIHKIKYFLIAMLIPVLTFAQRPEIEMADTMRDNGKIYVVVGVLLIILVGFFTYLIFIDRKLSKLKKELDQLK
jgi:CcmD family protein